MSVAVAGFESSKFFVQIYDGLATNLQDKKDAMKRIKAVMQFDVKQWTLDLKNEGSLKLGPSSPKADIVIAIKDADFVSLAAGKLNGQKAFMTGKLKIKGNLMLATRLDSVLKDLRPKAKL